MSSQQSVETEKSWPLGTQAAPVCEVGVVPHDRLMTADRSIATPFVGPAEAEL
jgi:hypothetical protein